MKKFGGILLAMALALGACGNSEPESQLVEIQAWFVQNGSSDVEALCLAQATDDQFTLEDFSGLDETQETNDEESLAHWLVGAREKCQR